MRSDAHAAKNRKTEKKGENKQPFMKKAAWGANLSSERRQTFTSEACPRLREASNAKQPSSPLTC